MKQMIMAAVLILSSNAFACVSGVEFYSVVTPMQTALISQEIQKLTVGDVLNVKNHLQVIEGQERLQELGFVAKGNGYTEGNYYLVKQAGKIVLELKADVKVKTVTYEASEPMRTRGGCGDHRSPASNPAPTKKK